MRTLAAIAVIAASMLAPPSTRATWAVVMTDTETGEVAIGQATCVSGIDLRALSAVIVTERGVATVQAFVDQSGVARSTIRDELVAGTPPDEILDVLAATDPNHETHQYCIVDTRGGAATYSGTSTQGFDFVGGRVGQTGSIRYCIAGNLLTGVPVVDQAERAIQLTPGNLSDRLLAAMQAARAMGGDGRCSCSPSNPTGCGSPPPSFTRSAINGYVVLARTGDTPDCAACSGGDYYMDLNVAFQDSGGTDPVLVLKGEYADFLDEVAGRPDAVKSVVTFDPPAVDADGISTSEMEIELLDRDGSAIGVPMASLTVEHATESDRASSIGVPVALGGGRYSVTLTAGVLPGADLFRVTADDGIRPVVLMPRPRLGVGVPAEVENLRWTSAVRLEWDAAPRAEVYHVYRGTLVAIDCSFSGACRDDLDPDRTDLELVDATEPASAEGFSYLLSSEDRDGNEGTLGTSSCGPRVNSDPCP